MARPTALTTLKTAPVLFDFERKSSGLPISPVGTYPESQGAESQVDYAAGSGAVSPCYDNKFPPYVTDHLGAEEFTQLVETITTKYMGIKRGKGHATKNFASQVLRIELSGPSRSHFSILDVPGIFSYAHDVNEDEEHGVRQMVEEYIRQTANIVICVAAATADLSTQEIFKMAANFVDKSRLVGVLTKCGRLENPNEVIDIASGYGKDSSRSMKDGWFVVRNRSETDDEELDFKEADRKLFSRSPWDRIPETRRGFVQFHSDTNWARPIKTQSVHAASFVDEIRKQLHIWQTTELSGMVNTEVIQILYKAQSEKWQQIAEHHIENIADDVERASNSILEDVCSPNNCSKTLYEELARALTHFQQEAKQKALRELKEHCRREREANLQTTDARFHERLQALRTVRLLKAIGASFASFEVLDLSSSRTLFHQLHHSIEGNMVNDVHDVVKVYYELSLEAFIRYTTNNIVEDFVSFSKGPLLGLSTDWVFTLTDEEVHRLAREDDETMERRSHYDGVIEKLQTAHEIAEKARVRTRNLGDM
ncbi:vacuolar sorting protein VPS1 [Colletotrichum cuscutae]|uniref:Vacuolar sorting protein VPS1 n=1 Tax=Colletotrichum cuscutae TaxID=1209917 RepID=A0AAI9Y263_9PEZI|nr:vacuolar sorting protein VPS1 [Colletotrichum cuscutae]